MSVYIARSAWCGILWLNICVLIVLVGQRRMYLVMGKECRFVIGKAWGRGCGVEIEEVSVLVYYADPGGLGHHCNRLGG